MKVTLYNSNSVNVNRGRMKTNVNREDRVKLPRSQTAIEDETFIRLTEVGDFRTTENSDTRTLE